MRIEGATFDAILDFLFEKVLTRRKCNAAAEKLLKDLCKKWYEIV